MLVRWEGTDTSVEVQRNPKIHTPVIEGTLGHLFLADRAALSNRLQSDPAGLFAQRLRESGKGNWVSGAELTTSLTELGFARADITAAWKRASRKFGQVPGVMTRGEGSKKRYKWDSAATEMDELPPVAADRSVSSHEPLSPSDLAEVPKPPAEAQPELAPLESESAPKVPQHPQGRSDSMAPVLTKLIGRVMADRVDHDAVENTLRDTPPGDSEAALEWALRALVGLNIPDHVLDAIRARPARAGAKLEGLSEAVLRRLLMELQSAPRLEFVAALACVPKRMEALKTLSVSQLVGNDAALDLTKIVREDLVALRSMNRPLSIGVRRHFVSRCVGHNRGEQSVALSLALMDLILEDGLPSAPEDLELLSDVMTVLELAIRSSRHLLASEQLAKMGALLAALPFEANGGRSSILAALSRLHAQELSDRRWWKGLTADHLGELSQGALDRAFNSPTIGETIVRPLVQERLRDATSRRQLAWTLAAPVSVSNHIDVDQLAGALRRSEGHDPWLGRLMGAVGNASQMEVLRAELDRTEERLAAERGEAKLTQAIIAELRAENGRLSNRLDELAAATREQHRADERLQTSRTNAELLDILTSVAQLAIAMESGIKQLEPDQLLGRLISSLSMIDLEPSARAGDTVSYTPTIHQATERSIREGELVSVLRTGWVWKRHDDDVVLLRAVVAKKQEGN